MNILLFLHYSKDTNNIHAMVNFCSLFISFAHIRYVLEPGHRYTNRRDFMIFMYFMADGYALCNKYGSLSNL